MKKLLTISLSILMLICSISLFACSKPSTVTIDGDYVVITVNTENVSKGASLKDYMDYLQSNNEINYTMNNGMIISINNKKGNSNQYWMLYTNDTENSNSAWGSCEYQGNIYNSASLGAEQLIVKNGCIYIWYLQSF